MVIWCSMEFNYERDRRRFTLEIHIGTGDDDPRDRTYSKQVLVDLSNREYVVCHRLRYDPIKTMTDEAFCVLSSLNSPEKIEPDRSMRDLDTLGYPTFDQLTKAQQIVVAFAHHFDAVYWWLDWPEKKCYVPPMNRSCKHECMWMRRSHQQLLENRRMVYVDIELNIDPPHTP